jgi:hypothetical protein
MMLNKIEGGNLEINPETLINEVAIVLDEERRKLDPKERPDAENAIIAELARRGISKLDSEYFLPKVRSKMADLYFADPDRYSLEKSLEPKVPELGLDDPRTPRQSSRSRKSTSNDEISTSEIKNDRPLTYGELSTESGLKGDDLAHLPELSHDTDL